MDSTVENVCLFDIDGTLADMEGQLLRDMLRLQSPCEEAFAFERGDASPPFIKDRLHLIKSQQGWWLNLAKLKSGFDVLEVARQIGFKIHVLTKGPRQTPYAWAEKLLWCQKHVAEDVDITIKFDKGLVYGKVLVDDFPDYALRWLQWRPRGLVIMPVHHYNVSFSHPNVVKYDGSAEGLETVRNRMRQAFERTPRESIDD